MSVTFFFCVTLRDFYLALYSNNMDLECVIYVITNKC